MPGIPEITPYEMPTDLPANVARWTVNPSRAVLLIHDMQHFFLRPFGGNAPAPALVVNTTRLRTTAAALGVPVAYTAQPGDMTPAERGLLKDFWGAGMASTPEDREVIAPLRPSPADWHLTKWRYSAFFNTELRAKMWRAGRDQLIVCGVYAHVGVLMSAVEAFTHDIQPFLVADAVADFTEAEHQLALDYAAGPVRRRDEYRRRSGTTARDGGGGVSPLDKILAPTPPPFALINRGSTVEVLLGEVSEVDTLANLPLPEADDVLVVVPYRQIAERGYTAPDDGTPLLAMSVTDQARIPTHEALATIPETPITLSNCAFDVTDEDYADTVRQVITNEIGQGKGANFVIKRSFIADITNYTVASALTLFRRLLAAESGAHWTFVIHTGDRTLVGASPERHVTLNGGLAVMNPISGTYRYPTTGPLLPELLDFLSDPKETDELFMVVDEELKMMSRVCEDARVVGPYLKEMSRLAHTEYFIEGHTNADVRAILRETLFAPTVTGSPLESATRVIAAYEPQGRGYYSGVAALISRDEQGERTLDSTILIRTADISPTGHVRLGVGATLVRHSNPEAEVAETKAKAAGVLAALTKPASFGAHPKVQQALASRNETIATFWRSPSQHPEPALAGRKALVVDAEDTFTAMLAHQLRALGLTVTVHQHDEPYTVDGYDVVVMGPGPGDPRDVENPKIAHLRGAIRELLLSGRPFLAVCLSHQILSSLLGLPLIRRSIPNQGVQKEINLFGDKVRVGFYNTFTSQCETSVAQCVGLPETEVSRDEETGQVHALRSRNFRSVQFHPESILSPDGLNILRTMVKELLVEEIAASA